ncbi:NUDIX domain-containing protein [Streptomyces sp. XM4193]|uniref:NUDIX hydrolase n=1 Tax=Streptomyces sp. XM4193 TaxID=2929782 RepID=UPI001FFBE7CF|nr:NUDIX domain-containing protein [Streptomyces sp. XM4193]MCK1798391.1 NUDIX domain-containing protein [Streptomyces sp. XM4193]
MNAPRAQDGSTTPSGPPASRTDADRPDPDAATDPTDPEPTDPGAAARHGGERPEPAPEPVERPTARVVLLDDRDRVLLFRSVSEGSGKVLWFPPGGGVEPGESYEEAALRELREETGLTDVELGPELWRREPVLPWNGVPHRFVERHFLARTERCEIDTGGFSAQERLSIHEHRWWTGDELRAVHALLVPRDLPDRLAELLANGPPDTPPLIGT